MANDTVVVDEEGIYVVTDSDIEQVVTAQDEIVVVSEAEQGPPGPPGPSGPPGGEEMKYTKRIDFVGNDVIYKGEAAPGTLQDAPNWRIRRLTIINEDIIEEWADGTAEMNKVWSSRDTYSYS